MSQFPVFASHPASSLQNIPAPSGRTAGRSTCPGICGHQVVHIRILVRRSSAFPCSSVHTRFVPTARSCLSASRARGRACSSFRARPRGIGALSICSPPLMGNLFWLASRDLIIVLAGFTRYSTARVMKCHPSRPVMPRVRTLHARTVSWFTRPPAEGRKYGLSAATHRGLNFGTMFFRFVPGSQPMFTSCQRQMASPSSS